MLARDDWLAGPDERGRAVQVFLSYRRGDVPGHAGRLADALRQRLGANSVFQDVVAIAPARTSWRPLIAPWTTVTPSWRSSVQAG